MTIFVVNACVTLFLASIWSLKGGLNTILKISLFALGIYALLRSIGAVA